MAVVIVLAYIVTRTKIYTSIISENKINIGQQFILMAIFGLFSIFGTLGGIDFKGAIANIRDLGPAIAGLIGGPLAGIGAGLIGGVHRFFLGGITYIPCSISTVLAGIAGGLIYQYKKGRVIGIARSVIFMALMEAFHMVFALLIVKPFSTIMPIIASLSFPMIFSNALGMGIFAFIVQNLIRERETQRVKELIESELGVARKIQMSIVPKIFPAFPDRTEFDIYALIDPAKEVGGDLYDFFLLDEDHLCLTIGDVSGKGVPASLFMAVTKTLIKAKSGLDIGPDQVLYLVNNELCKDNDSGMFATIFLGVLAISTGDLAFSNGGHNTPFLQRKNGEIESLSKLPGMALGVTEGIKYVSSKVTMYKGDRLVLYTDGVTEAMNPAGELLKDERLVDILQRFKGNTAMEATKHILDQTRRFVNGASQSDDIALLVMQYVGAKQLIFHFSDGLEGIPVLVEAVEKFTEENNLSQDLAFKVNLSLDELLTNTITYGYTEGKQRDIMITLAFDNNTLMIELRDDAIPFNPLDKPEPDITQDISVRPIGGLGIHIVRKMMDELTYRREDERNILTMRKYL